MNKYLVSIGLAALLFVLVVALAPTRYAGACGIGGGNVQVEKAERADATLRTFVRDTKLNRTFEQFWSVSAGADSTLRLSAHSFTEKEIFRVRIPLFHRGFRVSIPLDRDTRGEENGFTYEAQWLRENG